MIDDPHEEDPLRALAGDSNIIRPPVFLKGETEREPPREKARWSSLFDDDFPVTLVVGHLPNGKVQGHSAPSIDFMAGNLRFFDPFDARPVHLRPALPEDIGPDRLGGRANALLWVRDVVNARCMAFYVWVPGWLLRDDYAGVSCAEDYIETEFGFLATHLLAPIFERTVW